MAIRLVSLDKDSKRVEVAIEVVGDPGEAMDCEGVLLGSDTLSFPPKATAEEIASEIKARARELYQAGYQTWVLRNELALALKAGEA